MAFRSGPGSISPPRPRAAASSPPQAPRRKRRAASAAERSPRLASCRRCGAGPIGPTVPAAANAEKNRNSRHREDGMASPARFVQRGTMARLLRTGALALFGALLIAPAGAQEIRLARQFSMGYLQ